MPEVAEPPVNPGLAALFKVNIPEPEAPPDGTGVDDPAPFPAPADKTKRPEPEPAPAPSPAPDPVPPVVEPKPDKPALRLAPDFALDLKPPATAPVELDMPEEPPPHIVTAKAKEDYRKWRQTTADLHREVQTLRSKVAAPAAAPEDTETKVLLEQTTKERDELLARVERVDLMSSPKFQKEFIEPHDKVFAKAQGIVKEFGGDPAALNRAMSLRGTARAEALDEIRRAITSDTMRGQLDLLIRDIDDKRSEINEKLANSKKAAEEFRKQEIIDRHQKGEKSVTEMKSLLGAARKSLLEEAGWSILQKSDDPDFSWWNDDIEKADKASEEILFNGGPEQSVLAAVLAPQALRLYKLLQNTQSALKAANDEIAEFKGASPRITQERKAAVSESDAADLNSSLDRLRSGLYRK